MGWNERDNPATFALHLHIQRVEYLHERNANKNGSNGIAIGMHGNACTIAAVWRNAKPMHVHQNRNRALCERPKFRYLFS